MISHMDSGVARVVNALRDNGLLGNTLIVFASDVSCNLPIMMS